MCGFDQWLMALVDAGRITPAEAIANAGNRTDLTLKLRLASGGVLAMDDGGMSMAEPQTDAVVSRF